MALERFLLFHVSQISFPLFFSFGADFNYKTALHYACMDVYFVIIVLKVFVKLSLATHDVLFVSPNKYIWPYPQLGTINVLHNVVPGLYGTSCFMKAVLYTTKYKRQSHCEKFHIPQTWSLFPIHHQCSHSETSYLCKV